MDCKEISLEVKGLLLKGLRVAVAMERTLDGDSLQRTILRAKEAKLLKHIQHYRNDLAIPKLTDDEKVAYTRVVNLLARRLHALRKQHIWVQKLVLREEIERLKLQAVDMKAHLRKAGSGSRLAKQTFSAAVEAVKWKAYDALSVTPIIGVNVT